MKQNFTQVFIDTDNACGSPMGDIDDAFAIAAMLAGHQNVTAIASIFGNTSAQQSLSNTSDLVQTFNYQGDLLPGAKHTKDDAKAVIDWWKNSCDTRYLALGPLTNVARLLDHFGDRLAITEVVMVGANNVSRGVFPPWWPHEFNLTKDRRATRSVLESQLPLTICPLNVVKKLQFTFSDIARLPAPWHSYFHKRSRRWIWRNGVLKGRLSFAVWDLVAAMYVIAPEFYRVETRSVKLTRTDKLDFRQGQRSVNVVEEFDVARVKDAYFDILHEAARELPKCATSSPD